MSSSRKKLLLNTVSVKLGCGSCRRPKLCRIFHPKPKPKNPIYAKQKLYNHSSSSDTATSTTNNTPTNTATTFSPCYVDSSQFSESETYVKAPRTIGGFGRAGREGVAVEKDSDDPYLDFRHSMLQMIMENEIYSKDDLRELLNCFLQLNSPYHHGVIVRAFTEIWNGVFFVRSSCSPTFHFTRKPRIDNMAEAALIVFKPLKGRGIQRVIKDLDVVYFQGMVNSVAGHLHGNGNTEGHHSKQEPDHNSIYDKGM